MSEKKQFEFGQTVTDKITGFTGIIFGRAEYADGTVSYAIASKTPDTNKQSPTEWVNGYYLDLTNLITSPKQLTPPPPSECN